MPGKTDLYVLHGWSISPDNQHKWQDFLTALAHHHITAEFVPLPGFELDLTKPYTIDDYVDFLTKVLPPTPINLLGHSFGGQLALRLASRYPDRVKKLIMMDSAGLRSRRWPAVLKRSTFYALAQVGKKLTRSDRARKWLHVLAREKDYLNASPLMRQTMANVLAHDSRQDGQNLQLPTLLIWGQNDQTTPVWMAREYLSLIKGSCLQVIAGARHSPQFTHPTQTARIVTEFLS